MTPAPAPSPADGDTEVRPRGFRLPDHEQPEHGRINDTGDTSGGAIGTDPADPATPPAGDVPEPPRSTGRHHRNPLEDDHQ